MTGTRAGAVSLRPVTADDRPLLLAVYASTRAEELDQVAWGPGQREGFLDMQFLAQDHEFRRLNPLAQHQVIEVDGTGAGRLWVDRRPGDLRIVDLALLPAFRGRGTGRGLIAVLQRQASEERRVVSLHVHADSPARRLYDRLGFVVVEDLGVHVRMEWSG
jgi:ribosomal protein S18 acetylase RimI-like enzyme